LSGERPAAKSSAIICSIKFREEFSSVIDRN
jgi:hypothetical protein